MAGQEHKECVGGGVWNKVGSLTSPGDYLEEPSHLWSSLCDGLKSLLQLHCNSTSLSAPSCFFYTPQTLILSRHPRKPPVCISPCLSLFLANSTAQMLVNGRLKHTHTQIHTFIYLYMHTYIHIKFRNVLNSNLSSITLGKPLNHSVPYKIGIIKIRISQFVR